VSASIRLALGVAAVGIAALVIALAAGALESGAPAGQARAPRHVAASRHHAEHRGLPAFSTSPGLLSLRFNHPPRAALLFDLDSGKVLWAINPTERLPIASLAKMMTALLVVRSQHASARVHVTHNAVNAAGSKIGVLPVGKYVRLETLLYGLLLPSGNDAAVALAEHVAGSVPRFVVRMNEEARQLGLSCTHYVSPDGLEDANRSCAADLATLARLDLDEPRIARVASTAATVQPLPIKGGRVWLYNNNPLLRFHYPGAIGLKTGETEAAGRCLVGAARRGNVRLGVVLLGSPELGRQAEALLDRGFSGVYHLPPVAAPPVPKGL
jgi:serine-type D-Ala-D-Ala carboxypeptidase (penicillin-binding protein 5/6)